MFELLGVVTWVGGTGVGIFSWDSKSTRPTKVARLMVPPVFSDVEVRPEMVGVTLAPVTSLVCKIEVLSILFTN